MSITSQLATIRNSIPPHITLVAVSKTKPNKAIIEAYQAGQRVFGENKVQELCEKSEVLPKDIEWHMIGHLQRNKVKYIAPFVNLIHGIDSFRLLKEVNKQGQKVERKIKVLLQFHIAQEETKFGFSMEEAKEMLQVMTKSPLPFVSICGVMGMATFTENTKQVSTEFQQLKSIFEEIKKLFFSENSDFKEISMGMSGDYPIAIQAGSTMIRVGSSIFGSR